MSRSVTSAVADLRSTFSDLSGAWAACRDTAESVLAAVMGSAISRQLRFSDDYSAAESIRGDTRLTREIAKVSAVSPELHSAVEEHLEWVIDGAREGIMADLVRHDPKFTENVDQMEARIAQAKANQQRLLLEVETKIKAIETEAEALTATRGVSGMSSRRRKVIEDHAEQMDFVTRKANNIAFCAKAKLETDREMEVLKSSHVGEAKNLYHSVAYTNLQSVTKKIGTDRMQIELQLQAYFDHHSQGACQSESVKVERTSLKLPPKLEEGKAGFRLITAMEEFMVGRGNEFWAIMPDLRRSSHDIDPIEHMHWQPPILESDVPESLREARRDQNKALADKLLLLCSQMGLRATVLATSSFGAKKVIFQAPPNDGCAIFWVLLQKYHPVDLKQRREIEKDLNSIHQKFVSGDPKVALKILMDKIRQALDISCRIKWDSTGIPLIETLCARNSQFTISLDKFRDKPDDPEDSIVDLERMAGEIMDVIKILDQANIDWMSKRAYSCIGDKADDDSDWKKEIKFLKSELKSTKALMTKKSPSDLNPISRTNTCQATTCNRKIEGWKQNCGWKLCSTCLLGAVKDQKNLPLKDGGEWIFRGKKNAMKLVKSMGLSSDSPKVKKAFRSQKPPLKGEAKTEVKTVKTKKGRAKKANKDDVDTDDEPSPYAKRLSALRNGEVLPYDGPDDDTTGKGRAFGVRETVRDAREIIDRLRESERQSKKRRVQFDE